jgi:hypothetical protein
MAKAVGIGSVFLKARNPQQLVAWYAEHLGIPMQDGGSLAFDGPETAGMTIFRRIRITLGTAISARWSIFEWTTWTDCLKSWLRRA